MKQIFQILFLICLATGYLSAQKLTVVSYNLRGDDPRDLGNEWSARKFMVTDQIQKYRMDLIGAQETNPDMVGYLISVLPRLDSIGFLAKTGTGILYNKERLQLQNQGHFWLSPTPDIESKGWDAKFKRICIWGKFKDRASGAEYFFFNSHFDHVGVIARTNSTMLILQKIKEIAGAAPTVLLGDLNTAQYDPNYILYNNSGLKDSYNLALNVLEKERGTGNGFNINRRQRVRVDYVFLSQALMAYDYDVLTDLYNNHTVSDHYGVMATIGLKQDESGDLYRQFPEDFENIQSAKTGYGAGKIAARTGPWMLDGAILGGSSGNDRPTSGANGVRMVNGNTSPAYLQMDFDVNEGASKVVLQHGLYATDSIARWQLEYSTNQGSSWKPTGPVMVTHQGNKQQAVFIMDLRGKVRFRVHKLALGRSNNGRLSIDDFAVYRRQNSGNEKKNVTLLAWQFGSPVADVERGAASSFKHRGMSESILVKGEGFIAKKTADYPVSLSHGFITAAKAESSSSASDTTLAITERMYLEFKISPVNNYDICLSTLNVRLMTTGKERKVCYWKYSLDGVNFKPLAKAFEFNSVFPTAQHTLNLTTHHDLQHLTPGKTVLFRLYVNGLLQGNEFIGIGSSDKNIKEGNWSNPEVNKDYSLQLNGTAELVKK